MTRRTMARLAKLKPSGLAAFTTGACVEAFFDSPVPTTGTFPEQLLHSQPGHPGGERERPQEQDHRVRRDFPHLLLGELVSV